MGEQLLPTWIIISLIFFFFQISQSLRGKQLERRSNHVNYSLTKLFTRNRYANYARKYKQHITIINTHYTSILIGTLNNYIKINF